MALYLDEYGRWPLWHAPADTRAPIADGYGHLACFVSPAALEGQRGLSAGVGQQVRRAANGPPAAKLIAERLYEQLRLCKIRYDDAAPWEPGGGQRLRHPGWTLSPRESATCIDFATLFAAMCLRERVAPFLVMLRGERNGAPVGHVMVGLDLEREPESLMAAAQLGSCREESVGISRVTDCDFLVDDPAMLLVDPTSASRDRRFEQAVDEAKSLRRLSEYRDIHLIDVAVRHHEGDRPLLAPTARAMLRRRLPGPRHPLQEFPSRSDAAARLAGLSPRMVVVGKSGVGKSELARDAAARVDQGLGWFLNATNEAAFVASLAEAELAERGERHGSLDNVDRAELAQSALSRLTRADTPWAVVVDNANGEPKKLRRWLPRPDPATGQVLIITTINAEWHKEWHNESAEIIDIDPLEPGEAEALLGDARLVKSADGRPLLIQAFLDAAARLRLSTGEFAEQLGPVSEQQDELTGSRVLWELLGGKLTPAAVDVVRVLAWLLPDRTPVDVLRQAGVGSEEALREVVSAGLVDATGSGQGSVVSMHRLFGAVIRDDLREKQMDRVIVTRLLGVPTVQELLLANGDVEITTELAKSLIDAQPCISVRDRARGRALWALGTMQEMHEGVRASATTFTYAMDYLDEGANEDRPLIADCLHGRAREVNQNPPKDAAKNAVAVKGARAWLARAIELRDATDVVGRSTHQALNGLLLQRYARDALPPGSNEQIEGFREAQDILDESWRERSEVPNVDPRLVDRAYFNLAGVRIDLAQRVRPEAPRLLGRAEQVYRKTLEFRRIVYQAPSPLTAAAQNGLATCLYYQALLVPDVDQAALLLEATGEATRALEQRWATDGHADGNDTVKSASILAKIALARVGVAQGRKILADDDVKGECGRL